MNEIMCNECNQKYLVSELWLIDTDTCNRARGKGQVSYCGVCKKETEYTINESKTNKMMHAGFSALQKALQENNERRNGLREPNE
jgi:hypothetical protein